MHTAISPVSSFQLSSVAFFGRVFDEYSAMFGFDEGSLRGRRVLDVAAGPSAFTRIAKIGERVEPGDVLLEIHANDEARLAAAKERLVDALMIGPARPGLSPLIVSRV